ncbi:hypothetical protein BKE38_09025 [Pseudoroseomonas deserti]|uniref:Uncharacterized protein n=1 Tax=Teichococcus deserti TaxID=1817963 RepID=A0A1V2H3Q9_9PROT|nr:hypothetical protein [Pseudoroseomonas deserti]ONG55525.1 hypothetical protein BKE38_09025 [Pseudoroseomonas deserti]
MRRLGIVAMMMGLAGSGGALAQAAPQGPVLDIAKVTAAITVAETIVQACDARDPGNAPRRAAALGAWRLQNDIVNFERSFATLAERTPSLAETRRSIERQAREQSAGVPAQQPKVCDDVAALFAVPALQVLPQATAIRQLAEGGAPSTPATPAPAPVAELQRYTLPQLWTLATRARDAVAGGEARATRAQEQAMDRAIAALGSVVIAGTATGHDRLREWRGDAQSVLALRCRSFANDTDKQGLEALEGQPAAVAGRADSIVLSRRGSGTVFLRQCRLLPAGQMPQPAAGLAEAGGLEPRPLTAAEAQGAPGQGIDPAQVAKLVYTSDFRTMMDGMGNGYTQRDEDIHVLLRDGSAYRHGWGFPYQDLNLALSRRREPDRWLRWAEARGVITLTDAKGGSRVLRNGQALAPWPAETVLDHHWYFLHVGQGGVRRDRSYSFRADGTVEASRSSLVAAVTPGGGADVAGPGFAASGGAMSGHVAAIGPRRQAQLRYRVEGDVLVLTAADGRVERRLFARFASDQAAVPRSVVIGGEVYWTRDGKP